jgi:hypothetical protein
MKTSRSVITTRSLLLAASLLGVLAAAACGGSTDGSAIGGGTTQTTSPTDPASGASGADPSSGGPTERNADGIADWITDGDAAVEHDLRVRCVLVHGRDRGVLRIR